MTIRCPLYGAAADYPLYRAGERKLRSVFGAKWRALTTIERDAADLWERCEEAFEALDDEDAENVILDTLCEVPGLGPAKAGFVCQMVYGLSGCIDGHNLERFGLRERTFRYEKYWSARYRRTIVRSYNAFCRKVGGTKKLWDDWCAYVHKLDPVNYPSPEYVSELHLAPLKA